MELIFFTYVKVIKVSAETYEKIGINTIIVNNENNKPLIWLKMHDISDKLGVKNMYDLMIKEIQGILNNRNPIKQQIEKCKRWTENGFIYIYEELTLKIIMNCRVPTTV